MVDEIRTLRNSLFKALAGLSGQAGLEDDEDELGPGSERAPLLDAKSARALLQSLFARAGKGKDEVVGVIAREIGVAMAAMLKEPLAQLAKNQKLVVSFEFVPKKGHDWDGAGPGEGEPTATLRDTQASTGPQRPSRRARTKLSSKRRVSAKSGG